MSVSTTSGLTTTANMGDELQDRDVAEDLRVEEPDDAPLCSLLMNKWMAERPAVAMKVEWLDKVHFPFRTTLGASYLIGATTITVATGTGELYQYGDALLNEHTGEQFVVNGDPTGDVIPVERGVGSTSPSASDGSDDSIVKLGSSSAQGSGARVAKRTQATQNYNLLQDQRESVEDADVIEAIKTVTKENTITFEDMLKGQEHKRARDRAFYDQHRAERYDGNGSPMHYMGGVADFLVSNVHPIGTSLSQGLWETHVRKAYRYGSKDKKIAFISGLVAQQLASFPSNNIRPADAGVIKTWGVQLKTYTCVTGEVLPFVVNKHWDDAPGDAAFGNAGTVLIADMPNIRRRPLKGFDTKFLRNRQANDETRLLREWRTVETLEVRQENTHTLLRDIRPAA